MREALAASAGSSAPIDANEARFWRAAAPLLANCDATRSTMMGFPCLRLDGKFLASYDRAQGALLVKLAAERVDELIAVGAGKPFAPAGRRFREWVAIPAAVEDDWPHYLNEAIRYVGGS